MGILIRLSAFILVGMSSSAALGNSTFGGGTVPWPWPWAYECPIDFASLAGSWNTTNAIDKSSSGNLVIHTEWMKEVHRRYIAVEVVDHSLNLQVSGYAVVEENDRVIEMDLKSPGTGPVGTLELKIYHRSDVQSCHSTELVPIVRIRLFNNPNPRKDYYVLEPKGPASILNKR